MSSQPLVDMLSKSGVFVCQGRYRQSGIRQLHSQHRYIHSSIHLRVGSYAPWRSGPGAVSRGQTGQTYVCLSGRWGLFQDRERIPDQLKEGLSEASSCGVSLTPPYIFYRKWRFPRVIRATSDATTVQEILRHFPAIGLRSTHTWTDVILRLVSAPVVHRLLYRFSSFWAATRLFPVQSRACSGVVGTITFETETSSKIPRPRLENLWVLPELKQKCRRHLVKITVISGIFPTCFGCFLPANATEKKLVEIQKLYSSISLQY